MAAPIQSPTKCEVRSVVGFLNAKRERPAEIHKRIVAVYGNVMNRQNVTKWCCEFSEGWLMCTTRCKKKSWRGSKGRRHIYMNWGYRSWFQDLKCLDNAGDYVEKQSYAQGIHWQCRFCKFKMLFMFKTVVSLFSGHASCIILCPETRGFFFF
jgi:hypothetical protein